MSESLSGEIERVTFHNPENGFAVLKVKAKGRTDLVTVLGTAMTVTAGEHVDATGAWTIDREHGPQFKAQDLKLTRPTSAAGIERYLGSGAIRCVGPKLAEKIVRLYKERTLEIIEQFPEVLLHIRGIGAERLKRIRESWREQRCVRDIMLFLGEHGIGSGRAVRIYRTYGEQAIPTIRANPYQLADDIRGIGFKTADDLAQKLGLDPHSPQRAQAAVRYTLQQLTQQGHCAYPESDAIDQTAALLGTDRQIVIDAIAHHLAQGNLIREEQEGDDWLFLTPLHRAEVGIAGSIRRLSAAGAHPLPAVDLEAVIPWVEQRLGLELAEAQRTALREVCRHQVVVITGGPGVGKTTLVRGILEIFESRQLQCVLAAPTGRAAKRLAETTGRTAKTIHRLLEFDPSHGGFQKNAEQPLRGDLFLIDETSMVDVVLAQQLLRAIPTGAVVVFVGDIDQLPSVGPGTVLADLIASGSLPVVRLTEIFRQASHSRIVTAAAAINQGRLPELQSSKTELTDFYFVECEEPEAIQEMLVRLFRERIPQRFGLNPLSDIQVLSPMNRSLLGARQLNQVLQQAVNPPGAQAEVQRFGWTFRVGDRVIQMENNYDRNVFNGDVGVIQTIDATEQELQVSFEGRPVTYDFGDLDELALAYVLTIHKSQGSEYPCVLIPLHTQHFLLLQRNLLYTGITRGKKLVVLVGTQKALALAVQRQETQKRYTALRRRLQAF